VAIDGFTTIGKRIADVVAKQTDIEVVGVANTDHAIGLSRT
jgi:glyceraldehyde-3-phosphate dehydrogenase/erythrose-4-phosphate dehydrogenase